MYNNTAMLTALPVRILIFLLLFPCAWSKAHLWIRFKRFDNPGGKGDNGHCCDGRYIVCPSKCDHRFVVCIDRVYGRLDTSSCPYGKKVTSEILNQDSIIFQDFVGNVKNPMIFDFNSWPGRVRIKVGVWDKDEGDNGDDMVDFLSTDISLRPAPSMATARLQRLAIRDRVTLNVDVMVFCGPNSYGSTCRTVCVPQNDASAGYTCDVSTGQKLCLDGWSGEGCDVSVDDCLTGRCQHGATCVDAHLGYSCTCADGFEGTLCETNINECLSYPCQNRGSCDDAVNGFSCTCDVGWTGTTCETIDACLDAECHHGGTCYNVNGSFLCRCRQGFAGDACEMDLDECASSPCRNDGTCTDLEGAFNCTCVAGWTGVTCEVHVDECASGPCMHGTCQQHQDIVHSFICVCSPGYTGAVCDTDINECFYQACANGGTCINQEPGFRCACVTGFVGEMCEEDFDECLFQNPCRGNSSCLNSYGSYRCQCPPDFTGADCGTQIDDCVENTCQNNATCVDGIGNFRCACAEDWTGSTCDEYVSRCTRNLCKHADTCQDMGPGTDLICQCSQGWEGALCNQDLDECRTQSCKNGATCRNLPGSFACTCPRGWVGLLCGDDVDECEALAREEERRERQNRTRQEAAVDDGDHGDHHNDTYDDQYNYDPSQQACQHAGLCVNVDGGFLCQCLEGWEGERCQHDIDECLSEPCQNGAECCNTPGSFTCTCLDAWAGQMCDVNVDECVRSPCSERAECVNTLGGFSCLCPRGWKGDACEEDVNECLGQFVDTDCVETGGNRSCHTATAFPCPNVSCSNSLLFPCQNSGTCLNTPGDFECTCTAGWTGKLCDLDVDECSAPVTLATTSPTTSATLASPTSGSDAGDGAQNDSSSTDYRVRDELPLTDAAAAGRKEATEAAGGLPQAGHPCQHGGTCHNVPGTFSCSCPPQWRGRLCDEDVDECKQGANPCLNGGTCSNTAGSFTCACTAPWEGAVCGHERDECSSKPCANNGTCIKAREGGGVQCVCPRGWRGPTCRHDRDECVLEPCFNNGSCVNEIGGFRCTCPGDVTGVTCSNETTLDNGLTLPLYLRGWLSSRQKTRLQRGIKQFLQQHGEFRSDVKIRAYVQTQEMTGTESGEALTQVYIKLLVENVTLSDQEANEIFNRIPPQVLQDYLPLELFYGDVDGKVEMVTRPKKTYIPWYFILAGTVTLALFVAVIVLVIRVKDTVKWWPRKRSDKSIMFPKRGERNPAYNADLEGDNDPPILTQSDIGDLDGGQGHLVHAASRTLPLLRPGSGSGSGSESWAGARPRTRERSLTAAPADRRPMSVDTAMSRPRPRLEDPTYSLPRYVSIEAPVGQGSRLVSVSAEVAERQRSYNNALYLGAHRQSCPPPGGRRPLHLPPDPRRALPPTPGANPGTD